MSQEFIDKYGYVNSPQRGDIPEHLYHYTDAAGLVGMLNSGKIWATEYRFLNDKSELTHTEALTRTIIAEAISSTKTSASKKFCETLLLDPSFSPQNPAFVFSLSEEKDSLSQWRGYARDGQGFTIGFSGVKLLEYCLSNKNSNFSIRQVIYDHQKQETMITRAAQDAIKFLDEKCSADADKEPDIDGIVDDYVDSFQRIILVYSTLNKHQSFKSEGEWRIITLGDSAIDPKSKVRNRGLELVPYMELGVSKDGKLPISSIGIGPGFTVDNQTAAVRYLTQGLGYDVEVYAADSPYRRA